MAGDSARRGRRELQPVYREMLRRQLEEFEVCLLDYCLTSNHVHLLLEAEDRLEISGLMRNLAGEFA